MGGGEVARPIGGDGTERVATADDAMIVPHGLDATHAERLNEALPAFLGRRAAPRSLRAARARVVP